MKSFFKRFSLPVSLLVGVVSYLMFSQIEILEPIGDVAGPLFLDIMPVVLFTILYVTFCKIQIKEMKPRTWHFILQGIRIALSGFFVWLITLTSDADVKLLLEGMFICIICPTAAAAPVVTEKLGGSIGSLTIYTIIANVVTSVIIPLFFPMVEKSADIEFFAAVLMVLKNVTVVLVVPLVLALTSRKVIPSFTSWLAKKKDLGFYLWCVNLAIVSGVTMRNILLSTVSGHTLVLLIILPLFVTIALFAIGKAVGRPFGDSISAGQALGQKNTVVGIWLTISFLNPLAAVAPGAYVLWQNMVNAWQLWYKDKYGKLKW
ncbi:transporter [Prevotella sp. P2-180]|uniref:transporter n=1 Tax=Prevotella sp. P2-180 TaxID=2024224 RepID=UPI000B970A07|nr:transporter [Prevotella sp. P2-180]OYP64499.1 transporter [Prevotella sp. P2-180]